MKDHSGKSDSEILALLRSNQEEAIEWLFRAHYRFVCQAAYRVLPDGNLVEDMAQDVFFELWKKRAQLKINTSVRAYLKRAVINKTLNYIRSQRMSFSEVEDHPVELSKAARVIDDLEAAELEKVLHDKIDELPERCRMVFVLSRFEQLSYQEIATELDISVKTVENQISKALKILRETLEGYQKNS